MNLLMAAKAHIDLIQHELHTLLAPVAVPA